MNKLVFILMIAVGISSCKNDSKSAIVASDDMAVTNISFGVRGNCEMCKKTIESAANSVEGVTSAVWDVDKKKIEVSFDASKVESEAIHKAIADSGYDTDNMMASNEAYANLPSCCQYDHAMEMNQ